MKGLVAGMALLGGAAWFGSRSRRRLAGMPLAKAITPSMSDADFMDEVFYRAGMLDRHVDAGFRSIYDEASSILDPENPNCPEARQNYALAVDALIESRRAMRAPRIPRLVKLCSPQWAFGYKGESLELCRRFRDATLNHNESERNLPRLRTTIMKFCPGPRPKEVPRSI